MRTFKSTKMSLVAAGMAIVASSPLHAATPIEVRWSEVCTVAAGREMNIKTTKGQDLNGLCISVDVDEMSFRTFDGKIVRLARTALGKIRVHRARTGQLRALRNDARSHFRYSMGILFSPNAAAGLVVLPVTMAWDAIAVPFCALGDLHDKLHPREIKVI